MTQRKITVADIMSTDPCYSKTKVERLFGDLEYATIEQILACDIPIADRVFTGVHLLTERSHIVEFAKKCAKRAEEYADSANSTSANNAADYADNAAAAANNAADRAARAAARAANYAASATATASNNYGIERDLQIDHLNELHKREEKA